MEKLTKPRLNRRRFEAVTRLLKTLVSDDKAKIDLRFRAAERLLDLYSRLEDRESRAEDRTERALEREHAIRLMTLKQSQALTTSAPASIEADTPEDRARRFLTEVAL